jgi:aminoglycoside 6'-N-acetyltransferase
MSRTDLAPVSFRPVRAADFAVMTGWLNQPHVRRFYQAAPIGVEEVAAEYGPAARGEEPTLMHLALSEGEPFGYLQCYLNASYPEYGDLIGAGEGVSIDLYLGDPARLGRGYGRAMLAGYLDQVVWPSWPEETRAYIAHELDNAPALACSQAVGFRPLRAFLEDGRQNRLLVIERPR